MFVQASDCCLTDKSKKMKRVVFCLVILVAFASCKEEAVKEPDHLIEKGVMVDIMYDLSLLEAIRYNNPAALNEHQIVPSEYIYKKYKIDSLQFVQNNKYYASDYAEYKLMYDEINKRLEKNKAEADSLIKAKNKKALLLKKAKAKKEAKAKAAKAKLRKVADSTKTKVSKQ